MRALLILLLAAPASAQTFRRPTACDDCIANWFYVDQQAGSGVGDWNCSTSSYDGHNGSDFSLRGGNGAIGGGHDVVAGADGTVVSAVDGHYDGCRTCDSAVDSRCGLSFGFGYGNHVVINHGSYRVIYAHLRTGSVRVSRGDSVRCGDVIGQIGSSGCSTGAHLHFETRPLGGAFSTAFDPFEGMCSPTSPTLWGVQGPHRGLPGATCGPPVPACPAGTFEIWTCEGDARRRCIAGNDMVEPCAFGCVSMPVGTDDVCADPPDADGDGVAADVDCDDNDPGRYPGLAEICGDAIDQDCDGSDAVCPGADAGPLPPGGDGGPGIDAGARPPGVDGGHRLDGGIREGSLTGTCACRAAATRRTRRPPWAALALLGACRRRRSSSTRRALR